MREEVDVGGGKPGGVGGNPLSAGVVFLDSGYVVGGEESREYVESRDREDNVEETARIPGAHGEGFGKREASGGRIGGRSGGLQGTV